MAALSSVKGLKLKGVVMTIFKTRNGESGNGNGERGTGNGERGTGNGESLKRGLFKSGNL